MNGPTAPTPSGSSIQRNPRLLLAEDDPLTRNLLWEVLHADYEVEAVATGEQAWAAAQRDLPDLVLSDVLMPGGLDGIGLTRQLRAAERTRTLPIILLTASDEKELLLSCLDAGADDCLRKPFSALELLARLRCHRRLVQMRWEAAAHQHDERFRLIVESARDYAIFTFDAERLVTSWNSGAEVITGFAAADIIGRPMDLIYTPEDRGREIPTEEVQQAHAVGHYYNERWHLRQDGSRFWGSGVVMPLRETGPERGGLKILRDLTTLHEADAERARLMAAEQAARQAAEAANRTKDHFLATLSHELRTPLAPVQMALSLMDRSKRLPASVRKGIEMIRRNVAVEVRLISDLLDVSRIVHGKLELELKPLDLRDCLRQALEACQEDFTVKGLKLAVVLEADHSQVLGEATRLQQVFWNLLKNAAKFTPESGQVRVCSHNDGRDIVVEVHDAGAGIEAEALTRIFAPFEQGGVEQTRRYGGLGLGLAISQAIVAAHEGLLTAESPGSGHGATFRVRLLTTTEVAKPTRASKAIQHEKASAHEKSTAG